MTKEELQAEFNRNTHKLCEAVRYRDISFAQAEELFLTYKQELSDALQKLSS